MNLENVKTVHDVLIKVMSICTDIESAAFSLAESDFCPAAFSLAESDFCPAAARCGRWCSCIECWKQYLESEVSTNDHA